MLHLYKTSLMKPTTPKLNYWMKSVSWMINLINFSVMCVLRKIMTTYFQADLLTSNVKVGEMPSTPYWSKRRNTEESVVGILNKPRCSVDADQIEGCHQVSKNNKVVIVKFTRRKDWQEVWNKKKELEKINGGPWFIWAKKNIYKQQLMPFL